MARLFLFVFPCNVEHPETTGRLELFARYGPCDEQGRLRGGIAGSHVHTDPEIHQMIAHETREALFSLFSKPRATVEVVVDDVLPRALEQNYTAREIRKLLQGVALDSEGGMSFRSMQEAILASQRRRLQALVEQGPGARERGPKVPFQSKAAQHLLAPLRKKKLGEAEENLWAAKRTQNIGSLVASLEDQNNASQIHANVILARGLGRVDDRWDRYCSLRRAGKASFVQARNSPRPPGLDAGAGDRHGGCSSLLAAGMHRHA